MNSKETMNRSKSRIKVSESFDDIECDDDESDEDIQFDVESSCSEELDLSTQVYAKIKDQPTEDLNETLANEFNKTFWSVTQKKVRVNTRNKSHRTAEQEEIIRQALRAPSEFDTGDVFGSLVNIIQPNEKTKKTLLREGIVTAKRFRSIYEEEKKSTQSQKVVNYFDDDEVNEESVCEKALEEVELTQSLNDLHHSIELLSSSANSGVFSKVATPVENVESDSDTEEEDIDIFKDTEALETSFANYEQFTEVIVNRITPENATPSLRSVALSSNQINNYKNDMELPMITDQPQKLTGFSFASGKSVKIDKKQFEKFKKVFEASQENSTGKSIDEQVSNVPQTEFNRSSVTSGQNDKTTTSSILGESTSTKFSGFSFASGKNATLKNKSTMEKIAKQFERTDQEIATELNLNNAVTNFPGFGFASGKPAKINESKMEKQIKLFNDFDEEIEKNIDPNEFSFKTPVTAKEFASSRLKFSSTNSPKSSLNSKVCDNKGMDGFSSGRGKKWKIEEKTLLNSIKEFEKANDNIAAEDLAEVINSPPLKKTRLDFGETLKTSSPSFQMAQFRMGIAQHSTPNIPKRTEDKIRDEVSSILQECSLLNDSSVTIMDIASPKKLAKMKLEDKFNDTIDSLDDSLIPEELDECDSIMSRAFVIPGEVKASRKIAMEVQQREIDEKNDFEKQPMAGSVFMKKSSNNSRMKIKEYVENCKPQLLNRHKISFNNAIIYKFLIENYPEIESTEVSVTLADNAKLIFDEFNRVGINEISSAFLASPGVDPKLVKNGWIQNAFKFLILKFSHLENSFEKFEKFELLSPENLLLQMKYRYDREIDRSHRPCIKSIVQMDDVACRRLVLRVEDIKFDQSENFQLVLSDGWYSINSKIDRRLQECVSTAKIKVGTKLITSCADLLECKEGFDPLELPANVHLKIHANSTRRVSCHQKMGFCRNPYPFAIRLDTISEFGGIVGSVKVAVTHVYDVIYAKTENELKEFINERTCQRMENEKETLNSSVVEIVSSQIAKEEHERMKRRVRDENLRKKSVKDLMPDEAYDLLKVSADSDLANDIMSKLSNFTKTMIEDIEHERKQNFEDKIRQRVGERTQKFSRILRFRVVDVEKPSVTAIISWWSPNDDCVDLLKVGKQFELYKLSVATFRDEIQLAANSSTNFKNLKSNDSNDYSSYMRQLTSIEQIDMNFDPQHGELDIVCVVVKVENEDKAMKLQRVLVTDESSNFLYINFWTNLKHYSMENAVMEGKCFHVRNLQWRKNHKQDLKFPQAFVKVETSFISNSKNVEIKSKMNILKSSTGDSKLFVSKCLKLVEEIQDGKENVDRIIFNQVSPENSKASTSLTHIIEPPTPVTSTRKSLMGISFNRSRPNLRTSTTQKRIQSDHAQLSLAKRRKK